ncbi:PC4-domain-containing protein [Hypoxylon sp. FL0890]|nr:PC4-domain-containing protein [Hypoxylon sp. FL0890]
MGRTKNLKRSRRDDDENEDVLSDQEVKSTSKSSKSAKKAKTSRATDSGKDDEGNSFWSLGGTRRATVSTFKGKTFINIREYYTDAAGDLKPGKKGIMLTPEQYNKLLEAIPSINAELGDKGHGTPALSSVAPAEDAPDSPEKTKPAKKAKSDEKKAKANIEATSEEDEDSD